jgi:hypothetical protein
MLIFAVPGGCHRSVYRNSEWIVGHSEKALVRRRLAGDRGTNGRVARIPLRAAQDVHTALRFPASRPTIVAARARSCAAGGELKQIQ